MFRYRRAAAFLICAALLLVVGCSDTQSGADKAAIASGAETTTTADEAVTEPAQRDATIDEFRSCVKGNGMRSGDLGTPPAGFILLDGPRDITGAATPTRYSAGRVAEVWAPEESRSPSQYPQRIWFSESPSSVEAVSAQQDSGSYVAVLTLTEPRVTGPDGSVTTMALNEYAELAPFKDWPVEDAAAVYDCMQTPR
jgi:hypothetical protein